MGEGTCSVEGCTSSVRVISRGLCSKHYQRWRLSGDPLITTRNEGRSCSVDGCDLPAASRRMCKKHYEKWRQENWVGPSCRIEGCERNGFMAGLCEYHRHRESLNCRAACSEDGCAKPAVGHGLCSTHYGRATKDADRVRAQYIWRKYRITADDYARLLESQGGVCAVCHQEEMKKDHRSGRPWPLPVDHDHVTGRVRGLLCSNCNSALGLLGDDIERARAIVRYLEQFCD